jgi:hypothetical protein
LLAAFWPTIEPRLPEIIEGFYRHLVTIPRLKQMVGEQIPRLKQAQASHWRRLFSGRFDAAYFSGVQTIGRVHHKIGLEPRWYIGGYAYAQQPVIPMPGKYDLYRRVGAWPRHPRLSLPRGHKEVDAEPSPGMMV